MAVIRLNQSMVVRFLPLSINLAGDMTMTLRTGFYDSQQAWQDKSAQIVNLTAADVAAFMMVPSDGRTPYEIVTTALCQYAIGHGYVSGDIVPES